MVHPYSMVIVRRWVLLLLPVLPSLLLDATSFTTVHLLLLLVLPSGLLEETSLNPAKWAKLCGIPFGRNDGVSRTGIEVLGRTGVEFEQMVLNFYTMVFPHLHCCNTGHRLQSRFLTFLRGAFACLLAECTCTLYRGKNSVYRTLGLTLRSAHLPYPTSPPPHPH